MLLKVEGLFTPEKLELHEMKPAPGGDIWDFVAVKPKHLLPLGQVAWPDYVKESIHKAFVAIGVEDPMRQKLVDPFARAWGGREKDGAYDLDGVNWNAVIDYFAWEAAGWDWETPEDARAVKAMAREFEKKYGGRPDHHAAYGPEGGL